MLVSVLNATELVKLKRAGLLEVLTLFGHYSRENTVFDYSFHKWTKRVTSESGTAGKMEPRCCVAVRSTRIDHQLAVPVRYEASKILLFWIFPALFIAFCGRNVREIFSNFGELYAHQIVGSSVYFSGGDSSLT